MALGGEDQTKRERWGTSDAGKSSKVVKPGGRLAHYKTQKKKKKKKKKKTKNRSSRGRGLLRAEGTEQTRRPGLKRPTGTVKRPQCLHQPFFRGGGRNSGVRSGQKTLPKLDRSAGISLNNNGKEYYPNRQVCGVFFLAIRGPDHTVGVWQTLRISRMGC